VSCEHEGQCPQTCRSPEAELKVRQEVIRFCGLLHDKNFLAANDGNVSVRLCHRRVLITPTGVPKAFLSPEDLLTIDMEGNVLSGAGKPSGEIALHLEALRARPDALSVVHAHPPTCIALTLVRNLKLNDVLPEVILSVGRLEVVPYARPLTDALAHAVSGALGRADAVIMERHGTVTVGRDLSEAYMRTERLEHAAHVLWLAHALGRPVGLPEHEARTLYNLYAASRASTS